MAQILLGISGSIAAYKAVLVVRELIKQGHHCRVILSRSALRFVTAELITSLGAKVYTDERIDYHDTEQAMLHISLARWADRLFIVPTSANLLAKLAHGMADCLLTQVALAYNQSQPIYLAPAMNQQMWANSLTQTNLQLLQQANFVVWAPKSGLQACGEIGYGRLLEAEELTTLIQHSLAEQVFTGKRIVITLGATCEAIDPVRYLSNHSSGKMGLALIECALSLGAQVTAIYGKISINLPTHPNLNLISASSCNAMLAVSLAQAPTADVFIGCAAVCDYRLAEVQPHKIKKTTATLTLNLVKNPDIIATVKAHYQHLVVVGFAAETENWLINAQHKLSEKDLDLIIANEVGCDQTFNQDQTQISIINRNAFINSLPPMNKHQAAHHILTAIKELISCR
jgi:phosphopantothenoylcysteine decarboxylase/phosphopantothenate--cysteine ligase